MLIFFGMAECGRGAVPLLQYVRLGRTDVECMLAQAEPLDLAVNVFQHGVWGTVRRACATNLSRLCGQCLLHGHTSWGYTSKHLTEIAPL